MNQLEIWWTGIALAMDCMAVSVAASVGARRFLAGLMSALSVSCGLFQGAFFLAGKAGTDSLIPNLSQSGYWLAVAVLCLLGAKMLYDAKKEDGEEKALLLTARNIPLLAIATSIDALAVGVSFTCFPHTQACSATYAAGVIAFCSFLLSAAGLALGLYLGKKKSFPTTFVGGIILLALALKMAVAKLSVF